MKPKALFLLLSSCLLLSCLRKDKVAENAYDIILVIGQSNTHFGSGYDPVLDAPDERIVQLGRWGENKMKIIPATQPLDHHTKMSGRIGIGLPFSKLYADDRLEEGRKVLLVPAAAGGTAFIKGEWNKGDEYYEDAVSRFQFAMSTHPDNKLVAILWHQGESDADWDNKDYQDNLDAFIDNIRTDLRAEEVPFLLGGMVPEWVATDTMNQEIQGIIKDTPNRLENTFYVDPEAPYIISGDPYEPIHFDAAGIREMAKRYWGEFKGG